MHIITPPLPLPLRRSPTAWVGVVLLAYALLVYPMLGQLGDHPYPDSPSFGLPCPTTIFTFGLLLLTTERVPRHLFAIPLLWAAIGSTAAVLFGVWEDVGLGVAAIAAAVSTALRGSCLTQTGGAYDVARVRRWVIIPTTSSRIASDSEQTKTIQPASAQPGLSASAPTSADSTEITNNTPMESTRERGMATPSSSLATARRLGSREHCAHRDPVVAPM